MANEETSKKGIEFNTHEDADMNNIVRISYSYAMDSKEANFERWNMNRQNYDTFHLKQDYSHKREGQSREFLGKQRMAVEQITQFFQQGLVDMEDWFKVDYSLGVDPAQVKITKEEIRRLIDRQLKKTDYFIKVGDSIKTGLLGALCIFKVGGKYKPAPFYRAEQKYNLKENRIDSVLKKGTKMNWELSLGVIMPENFYSDQTGRGLFNMDQSYADWYEVDRLTRGDHAIYDAEVVSKMPKDYSIDYETNLDNMRRAGTTSPVSTAHRKQVKLQEFWGSIVDITTGELLHENVIWTIANDRYLIRKPTPNPFWHGENPYVVAPLMRTIGSDRHYALMDAPSMNNKAVNELYNLVVDGGMMATYGIKQFRPDWLEDDAAYSEGFFPGQSVAVNSSCPPGAKAIERVDTATLGQESLAVLNLMNQEFNQSALTNDLRMGVMPNRAVKATEVVEANQSISSVFSGMSKQFENESIEKVLDKAWKVTLQHMNDLNSAEVQALLGPQRAQAISAMSPEERFAECISTAQFSVWGISRNLTKTKDFRKLTSLLQTLAASPQLMQEFTQKYSMTRFMDQLMRAVDINTDLLVMTPEEQQAAQQRMIQMMQAQAAMAGKGQQGQQPGTGPNAQSQIPQAGSTNDGSMNQTPEKFVGQSQGGMSRAGEEMSGG